MYIIHSESRTQTFHPKCYYFYNKNELWYSIGSNNLTAGGLFNNYELSITEKVTGELFIEIQKKFDSIYNKYTANNLVCKKVTSIDFLKDLLNNGYITTENQIKSYFFNEKQNAKTQKHIFGNKIFSVPSINVDTENMLQVDSNNFEKQFVSNQYTDADYLIRFIPKAGNRSSQVHFTLDLLKNYFSLKEGDSLYIQQMSMDGKLHYIESRQIVLSSVNRNVKIEIAGASILDTSYPTDKNLRPILVMKKINFNFFCYMILFENDMGYTNLHQYLNSFPHTRALPSKVIDEATMLSLWNDCPLM